MTTHPSKSQPSYKNYYVELYAEDAGGTLSPVQDGYILALAEDYASQHAIYSWWSEELDLGHTPCTRVTQVSEEEADEPLFLN